MTASMLPIWPERMMDRHHYTMIVTCPACANGGDARVSEGDRPVMASPEFRIDAAPPGIEVVRASDYKHETEVACRCGCRFKL